MEKMCETIEEAYERYKRENKKHFPRWSHEFDLVKAWLAAGGRVIPVRYDGYGFYLFQENENIMGKHVGSRNAGVFCRAENGLMDEGFIIVPNGHEIKNGVLCPEWFKRTGQK